MEYSYKLFQINKNKDISLYKATLWQNLYKALTGNNSTAFTSSQMHLYFRVTRYVCLIYIQSQVCKADTLPL